MVFVLEPPLMTYATKSLDKVKSPRIHSHILSLVFLLPCIFISLITHVSQKSHVPKDWIKWFYHRDCFDAYSSNSDDTKTFSHEPYSLFCHLCISISSTPRHETNSSDLKSHWDFRIIGFEFRYTVRISVGNWFAREKLKSVRGTSLSANLDIRVHSWLLHPRLPALSRAPRVSRLSSSLVRNNILIFVPRLLCVRGPRNNFAGDRNWNESRSRAYTRHRTPRNWHEFRAVKLAASFTDPFCWKINGSFGHPGKMIREREKVRVWPEIRNAVCRNGI